MAYVDLANRVYNGPSYMDLGAPSGVVWDARLDLLPLSTTANASELRAALTAMGLTLTRASSATVQTSASEVVTSGIGVDDPRVGRYGLVIEESRQNLLAYSRAFTGWSGGTATTTADYAAGPDGSVVADRVAASSGQTSPYKSLTLTAAYHTASLWVRDVAGGGPQQCWFETAPDAVISGASTSATWQRKSVIKNAGAGTHYWTPVDGRNLTAYGGLVAGARDNVVDLHQIEAGKFATEAIITTGAAATRAGERLAMSDASRIIRSGRLSMARRFVPKGSIGGSNDYSAAVRLWTVDASNYAELHQTTGVCTVVVAGASYSTAAGFTWAANDVVDYWIEAGGGSLQTVVKARKNSGAVTTLGTGAAQGTIPNNAGIDLASNGTSAVLTASHQQIQAFAPGRRIAWAS